jgi:hypothetical protein
MSADRQILPIDQIESLEAGERSDQPGIADQPLFEGGQASESRGGDASLRANKPKSDASTRHDSPWK